ncbi:MFS transporter [Granulosicoccus sp. 3-233]|uniref:MFS transporter n=1 Tax=Granulosicoccus sp. 3-233 TaxID=3417969 RepID=UPI003D32F6C7
MKGRSIILLVLAEVAAMTLWFVSSATLADQQSEIQAGAFKTALLVSGVPAGFVAGALYVAMTGIADRFDPRRVFAVAALLAAVANAAMLLVPPGSTPAILLRIFTGFCLAGVYPVGMKIMVGWGKEDRGWLVGLLVGGLTLGSAAPHLLSWLGGSNWQLTTLAASCLSVLASLLVLQTRLGPYHTTQARFDARQITLAWTDIRLRRAFLGYLGHVWELYAMWGWVAPAAAASYALRMSPEQALEWSKLTAFVAIGSGALLCPFAGRFADRLGKAELTILAMGCSCLAALLAAVVFGGPALLVAAVFIFWGLAIIPDSAQFSALVADFAPPEATGSLMSLQTALGFALTIVTVQLTPLIAESVGWPLLFCFLALGPFAGILGMWKLRRGYRSA